LLFSAVEAAIVFPLSLNDPARREPWAGGVSIGLIAGALIVVVVMLKVVGRDRPPVRRLGYFLYIATLVFIAGLVLDIARLHWPTGWLTGKHAAVTYALVLAALGVWIVGRARGIGIGLLIQGHDKTGADDA